MNVCCVDFAPQAILFVSGMNTYIQDELLYYKLMDGLMIAMIKIKMRK